MSYEQWRYGMVVQSLNTGNRYMVLRLFAEGDPVVRRPPYYQGLLILEAGEDPLEDTNVVELIANDSWQVVWKPPR